MLTRPDRAPRCRAPQVPDTAVSHNYLSHALSATTISVMRCQLQLSQPSGVRHPVGSLTPGINSDLTAPTSPDNASSAVARMAFGAALRGVESHS